jgi:GNAT superfamily N-acetyltransferase
LKTLIGDVPLNSGETMAVSCVLGPEPPEASRIEPFLAHKGGIWNWHTRKTLQEPLDDLEGRYYVGEIDGEIVGNICTFECEGAGILGHVFTVPDHRHKGVASGIMNLQMDDFRQRGGKAMTLGTGYGSNAYRIYQGFGFESVVPGSGQMRYSVDPGFFDRLFEPAPVSARRVTWGDGPWLNFLFMRPGEPLLRNLAYGAFGQTNMESIGIKIQHDRENGKLHSAWVLATPERIPAGFATLTPHPLWPGPVSLLSFCLHPNFESQAPALLRAIEWPEGKVQTCIERGSGDLFGALLNFGFRNEGHQEKQLRVNDEARDVVLFAKEF